MSVRPARAADAPQIAAIWGHYIRETLVTFNAAEKTAAEVAALIAERQAAGHGFFVAEDAGRVMGFATYGQFRGGVGYARTMEHTILLDPLARGGGHGRALMAAVEDHARAGGAHSIFAGVSAANADGVAFHAAMGYAEVARLREVGHKQGLWLDLVLMQKFLHA
ncbi:GNAT family N-acetyltransferase [Rhodovulum adriaticum]|uniref:Phosphinothricin acetyltransferase n=1 Tax=Rhodovulum adriaticum TaxID=35804 RepID=A0A4R2NXH6_RHOAD|nr:GNAT family N-acetyltransferase [Rhodovulum adriaticum]MBK1635243.1 GNAT family N-acetyltransferase [Rhodovulum adriaticum]TCP26378.1 phosphinothricin acetyltransferase [Rhodovulum adriaticum]